MLRIHDQEPSLFDDTGTVVSVIETLKVNKGLFMSVHLKGEEGQIIGYKAKKHVNFYRFLKTLGIIQSMNSGNPLFPRADSMVILEPESFYIFGSPRSASVPAKLACEMIAYDTGSGELRTHYAGARIVDLEER